MSAHSKKVVLAYSGGLDTSVILKWIQERYRAEVTAFVADLGQGEDLEAARRKALRTGAHRAVVEDLREPFVRDYVFPMLRSGAVYEGAYLLGTSIARPLIARRQVEIARRFGADAVAHGATGKGNDQVRFELTYAALAPELEVIAPWREWTFQGRADLVDYARAHGIPVGVTRARPWSSDRNALHVSFEGGILEDPWAEPPESMFEMTVDPRRAPGRPEAVEVGFEGGDPVSLNGRRLSPFRLLEALNRIAGRHGVGRVDLVENRFVGIKSRGVYETPGGTVLHHARRAVESLTLDREVLHLRDALVPRYSELVYNGFWFAPEREALQAFMDRAQEPVTGTARLRLYRGGVTVVGRKSPKSLYRPGLASFEGAGGYVQADATGFIRLQSLRLKVRASRGNPR